MMPIAVFYHCLFMLGEPPRELPNAYPIVKEQMRTAIESGLIDACSHFVVGVNGNEESELTALTLVPEKTHIVQHGLKSRAENLTIIEIEKWVPSHPDWLVLYFHCKGATHTDPEYLKFAGDWRTCMMRHCVQNWRRCVADLESGYDSVGCHWLQGVGHENKQNIWAGNFWWATSNFLSTLPSMYERDRIKESGIAALESRYESEVWIGNGKTLPKVKDYHLFGSSPCN